VVEGKPRGLPRLYIECSHMQIAASPATSNEHDVEVEETGHALQGRVFTSDVSHARQPPPRKTGRGDTNRRKPTSALQAREFLFPLAGRQARYTDTLRVRDVMHW